jgi:hypothetical protein
MDLINYIWIGKTNYYKIENKENIKIVKCIFDKYNIDIVINEKNYDENINKTCDDLYKVYSNLLILENDYDTAYVDFLKCLYLFIKDLNYKNDIIKLVFINGKEVLKKYFTDLYFYNNPT